LVVSEKGFTSSTLLLPLPGPALADGGWFGGSDYSSDGGAGGDRTRLASAKEDGEAALVGATRGVGALFEVEEDRVGVGAGHSGSLHGGFDVGDLVRAEGGEPAEELAGVLLDERGDFGLLGYGARVRFGIAADDRRGATLAFGLGFLRGLGLCGERDGERPLRPVGVSEQSRRALRGLPKHDAAALHKPRHLRSVRRYNSANGINEPVRHAARLRDLLRVPRHPLLVAEKKENLDVTKPRITRISSKPTGDDAKAKTARIARDAPDVLERMKAGEFASVAEAERAAGIAPPKPTPVEKARKAIAKAPEAVLDALSLEVVEEWLCKVADADTRTRVAHYAERLAGGIVYLREEDVKSWALRAADEPTRLRLGLAATDAQHGGRFIARLTSASRCGG